MQGITDLNGGKMKIEELKNEVIKLLSLLEDPHPGLTTWNFFLNERLKNITALYNNKNIDED